MVGVLVSLCSDFKYNLIESAENKFPILSATNWNNLSNKSISETLFFKKMSLTRIVLYKPIKCSPITSSC